MGRQFAMKLTMFMTFVGALGSATSFNRDLFIQLYWWRFLLGIGAGGVYPLSATVVSEGNEEVILRVFDFNSLDYGEHFYYVFI